MELVKNGLLKISDAIEKYEKIYKEKLANIKLTEDQADVLYQVAVAQTGFWANSIKKGSVASDAVSNVKIHAIDNIITNIFKISNPDHFEIVELMDSKLNYECLKYASGLCGEYVYIQDFAGETDILDYSEEKDIYVIYAEDGFFEGVSVISTCFCSYGLIRLRQEDIKKNEMLLAVIKNLGLNMYRMYR